MGKKTYNPTTGNYDDISTRSTAGYNIAPVSFYEDRLNTPELDEEYAEIKEFETNKENYDLINKSGYDDVIGFGAYNYTHDIETKQKYNDLLSKYNSEFLSEKFGISQEEIDSWSSPTDKPLFLKNYSDEQIKTIGQEYINNASNYYNNVTKPFQEEIETKHQSLLESGVFDKGILHFSDLSEEEKEAFKLDLKQSGKVYDNEESYNNVRINRLFIQMFGEEAFKLIPFKQRKELVQRYSINSLIDEKFKDDPLLYRIKNLSTQDKIDLYNNSLFLNYKDASKEEEEEQKRIEEIAEETSKMSVDDGGPAGGGIISQFLMNKIMQSKGLASKIDPEDKSKLNGLALEKRETLLEDYERNSNAIKLEEAKPTIEAYQNDYNTKIQNGELSLETINAEFDEVFKDMLPHYWVFKNDRELKDFTVKDKVDYLSTYKALADKDPLSAMQVVNDNMQKFISDEQGIITKLGYGTLNGTIGTVAQLVGMANGVIGLASTIGGMDNYSDWMNSSWVNYWDKVDKYNTFNINTQDMADAYGGISPWKGVKTPGEEYNIFTPSTLEEVTSMGKYVLSTLIATYSGVGIAGKIGKWAGVAGKSLDALKSTAGVLSQAWAASGMAQTMAKGTYDETYNLIKEQLLNKVDFELQNLKENPVVQNQVLNEFLNSSQVNALLQTTLEQASKEWDRNNRRGENNLTISKDQYLNNIKNDFLNNIYNEAKTNVGTLIENKYANQLLNTHLGNNEEDMKEAAARAAAIQASISWGKEFAAGFLWNKWMVHKNARLASTNKGAMKDLVYSDTGVKAVNEALTTSDYLKLVVSRPAKEFADESFDAHSEHFAQGFGLQNFNNITGNEYNPHSYLASMNTLYNLWSPTTGFGGGVKSVVDGFFEDHVIYEGLIGAISGIAGTNVNLPNVLRSFSKEGRASLKEEVQGKNALYKLNSFITNGLIDDIVTEQQTIYENKELADIINNQIQKNGVALKDIHSLLSAYSREEESIYQGYEEEAKNNRIRVGFELGLALQNPILQGLPTIVKSKEELQRIADGNITEDDINKVLNQPENKSIKESNSSREEAITTLQQNANELLSIIDNTTKSFEAINTSKYGKLLSDDAKKQLVFNRVFDIKSDEVLNSLEASIKQSDNVKYNTSTNINAEFNSQEGLKAYIEAIKENIESLTKRQRDIENKLKRAKKGIIEDEKFSIDAFQLDLETLKYALTLENEALEEANNVVVDENNVLSAEDILSLNPEQRANMLNPHFKRRYNKKQQAVIDDLISKLNRENPKALEDIQQSGKTFIDKRLNNAAYDKIINNHEVFDGYVQYMKLSFAKRAAKAAIKMIKNEVANDLQNIKDEDLFNHVLIGKKSYNSKVIKLYKDDYTTPDSKRADILSKIEKILVVFEELGSVIDTYDQQDKENLRRLISNTIGSIPLSTAEKLIEDLITTFTGINDDLTKKALEVVNKVSKLHSQINITSEGKEVNRNQRVEDSKQKTKDEKKDLKDKKGKEPNGPKKETPAKDVEKEESEESPSIQEQASDAKIPVQTVSTDFTDEGNDINSNNLDIFIGNIYPEFETSVLNNEGVALPKKGQKEGDTMNTFYNFIKEKDFNIQEVVDFELGKIIKKNPNTKVYFMMHKNNNPIFNNFIFNVIKYDENVKSIHKSNRGVITLGNGEQYLVIGSCGTNRNKSKAHVDLFVSLKERMLKHKIPYFNSTLGEKEEYWVSNEYTYIKDIQTGRRVKRTENEGVKIRKISELLYDSEGNYNEYANPTHIGDVRNKTRGYSGLSWFIQKSNDYIPINTGSKQVIRLSVPENNNGSVFLLIETANNKLLPIYINPTFYSEISNGKLKEKIDTLLVKLTSKDFEKRKDAKIKLKQFLALNDDNTFTIGKQGFNTISIKRNGSVFKSFDLDKGVNVTEFLDSVKESNFRINITVSTLQTPNLVAEYDEAGALTTDVSVLHTRNASYTVYTLNDNGEPIIKDAPSYNVTQKQTARQIQFGNKRYRFEDGTFKDELDNIVLDKELIKKLQYAQQLSNMEPSLKARGNDYYIIDSSIDNPVVIRQGQSNDITLANKKQALSIIEEVNKIAEAKAKAEAAKKELEAALAQAEEVNLDDETPVILDNTKANITSNQVITPQQQTVSQKDKKDINNAGNISLENLDNINNLTTFAELYKKSDFRNKLRALFKEKGWTFSKKEDVETLLKNNNVPTIGITNLESWLDLIKNCR